MFTTNNKILLNNTHKLPTVFCVQRKAEKKIPTEADIVLANKRSFGDAIGSITNIITSQICLQASFDKESREYKELAYRVLCGQAFQQESIDKAKGIIAKPMPKYWKSKYGLKELETDTEEEKEQKRFLKSIAADKKPYFFIYNYDKLHSEYNNYIKRAKNAYMCEYGTELMSDYEAYKADNGGFSEEQITFFEYFERFLPIDMSPCTVNRMCWAIEQQTKDLKKINSEKIFDWHKLKSPYHEYSDYEYKQMKGKIEHEYEEYKAKMQELSYTLANEYVHGADKKDILGTATSNFIMRLNMLCPNEELRTDVLIEVAYKTKKSKKFVWDICGRQIVRNLLERHGGKVSYPVATDIKPDFIYHGVGYSMVTEIIETEESLE